MNPSEDYLDYAAARRISVDAIRANSYSRDRNLWHLSHEGGELEDPNNAPHEDMWQLTVSPEKASNRAEEVRIDFEQGTPVGVNGHAMGPVALVEELNAIG